MFGYDTYFLTGSDEHGQKVAASAEKSGRSPLEHCDFYVNAFKELNNRLGISNTSYIRTTDPYHESSAKVCALCGVYRNIEYSFVLVAPYRNCGKNALTRETSTSILTRDGTTREKSALSRRTRLRLPISLTLAAVYP